jgi:dynein heavy chain
MDKVIQLYEMIVVRHGLMVVGPTMGGKSSNIHILQAALSMLHEVGEKGNKYEPVKVEMINPKSIQMSQLYGSFDVNTHEWHDGVLAKMIRDLSSDRTSRLEWVHFDGPVDTIWIESLNTVLDDNKKLCLNSGAVLPLSDTMTMMFEPADLAVASPATVSRCGMVYMEPTSLGHMCLIDSWLQFTLPSTMRARKHQKITTTLRNCFDNYVRASFLFLRRFLKEPVPTVNNSLVNSLCKLLDCFFEPFQLQEGRQPPTEEKLTNIVKAVESYFIFALIWSIGSTCDRTSRAKFDAFFRQEMILHACAVKIPDGDGKSIYDFALVVDEETCTPTWTLWENIAPPAKHDTKAAFADMIIQTADTIKYTYLLEILVENSKHCLIAGPTGTGKTVNIAQKLFHGMPKKYVPLQFTFSARTSANMTQNIIDGKTDKRRKGIYGPMVGKKFVIFVDDVNMPQPEIFGAQPPIELLRQWCCAGGWYDLKELTWRSIVDTILVLACAPPGGGRNAVTPRFFRHFNLIGYTEMQNDVMESIFGTILKGFLSQFSEECQGLVDSIVHASIQIFNTCSAELLPTPAKSHYTFNLRDLAKVFQGMLMATTKTLSTPQDVVRMWVHECSRVFGDRLVNDVDRTWFTSLLNSQLSETITMEPSEVIPEGELIFADFMVPGADPKLYAYVSDTSTLLPVVQDYLQDYNVEITGASMDLIMFMDAIKHISKISRVLRQPRGNALLLGVGGSGRQSLTRLASFMAEYETKQIEIKKNFREADWHEDLRSYLMLAGVENKHVTFLFVDTQIVFEGMLEDVNNVLNSGDVPNLYGPEEMEAITSVFAPLCKIKRIEPSKLNIFNEYVKRVQSNLHVVVAMSPVGDAFRRRLLMYPALINCCTIDWFSDWPDEALQSVATDKLSEGNFELGDSFDGVVAFMKEVHRTSSAATIQYREEAKRWNYVTPTSYLQLISTYRSLLGERRDTIGEQRRRLKNGYDKIIKTEKLVNQLEIEVKELEPVLAVKNKSVGEMIVRIDADKVDAAATKAVVDEVRASAEAKAAEASGIRDSATRDLDKALPLLAEAVEVLNKLKKDQIDIVKSFTTVRPAVEKTMMICCQMFDVAPKMMMVDGKKTKNWHASAKINLLGNPKKFVDSLKNFDKDSIPAKKVKHLKHYFEDPECEPDKVKNASQACFAVACWARAMYQYDLVVKEVEPKRVAQAAAEAELATAQEQLAGAVAELKVVEDRIALLEAEFKKANDDKQMYEDKMVQCSDRLVRASQLTTGLGGEKVRWLQTVEELGVAYDNLVGDVLVSAGYVAYLGAFTPSFRAKISGGWRTLLSDLDLPRTPGCDIRQTLADPVLIRSWNVCELPTDNHSIENGIMMQKAWRWSLFIDPQGQANRFIKNLGKEAAAVDPQRALMVTKQTAKDFARTLENGVRFGREVLLENIGEDLDATLEPILQRSTFKAEGSTVMIKIGDSTIAYDDRFRFYMTTKLPNPHYPPEVCVKVTLLNFTITPEGLSDQLLGVVTEMELPELQARNLSIVRNIAKMNKELKDIQDKILYLLSNAEEGAALLDNVELIDALSDAKVAGDKITVELADAEVVKANIDATRVKYLSVAERGSTLYFCIAGLRSIAPMYEYSLQWFTSAVFRFSVASADTSDDLEVRKANLIDYVTYCLYENICRSLFERHKLLLSFLMAIRIARHSESLSEVQWGFLITGTIVSAASEENEDDDDDLQRGGAGYSSSRIGNPAPDWIEDQAWKQLTTFSEIPGVSELHFLSSFASNVDHWRAYFDDPQPHVYTMPDGWNDRLDSLQKMCILRCLRPDKIVDAVQLYVIELMDERFVKPPPFSLSETFTASSVTSPLIFVLSKGSDPTKLFNEFAAASKMTKKCRSLSLGQGQDRKAEAFIKWGQEIGGWVYLQNCHLYVSWMNTLERLCEDTDQESCHRDYRLWLSSMPSSDFPVAVLQIGVKMTLEPPKGMRSNMRNAYYSMTDEDINKTDVPAIYRKMLFALLFFHALVQERKKYGPLGWNISYSFNDTDSDISRQQLELFLNLYPTDTPFKVLHFLTAYINYGGRVTDYTDLRVTDAILIELYTPKLLEPGYKFSESGLYYSIDVENEEHPHAEYMSYIDRLPINPDPEVFGMHANANITCARAETDDLFDTMVTLESSSSSSSGGGSTREEIVEAIAADVANRLPSIFDIEAVQNTYPRRYDESMNTVLAQECGYYNKMIAVLQRTLPELRKAMKGLVVLSPELESIANAMVTQRVPEPWGGSGVSYPCLKPLTGWINEFFDRLNFLQEWIDDGIPVAFWLPGFYFPQAFLTGALQNYARKFQLPIDQISFDFNIETARNGMDITERKENGVIIYGLYLEGARWDMQRFAIADSFPKKLFSLMPVIHLDPVHNRPAATAGVYRCPVYKVISRWGILATTGHSSNFIMWIELPSDRDDFVTTLSPHTGKADSKAWIKAGVAAFCSLKY